MMMTYGIYLLLSLDGYTRRHSRYTFSYIHTQTHIYTYTYT